MDADFAITCMENQHSFDLTKALGTRQMSPAVAGTEGKIPETT